MAEMTAAEACIIVAERSGLQRGVVEAVVLNFVELVASNLKKGGAFTFGGWMSFKLQELSCGCPSRDTMAAMKAMKATKAMKKAAAPAAPAMKAMKK